MSQPVSEWSHLEFDLADRLRRALRISNTSVQEMADELGLMRNSVSRYINGHGRPGRAVLRVWSLKTGVPLEWLEEGSLPLTHGYISAAALAPLAPVLRFPIERTSALDSRSAS